MPRKPPIRLVCALAAVATALAIAAPSAGAAACDRVASPAADAAQELVDSLSPGQTGCLRAGAYQEDVKITTPGVTLTRYGAERVTVRGRLWVARSADGVTVEGLYLDGSNARGLPSPTINATRVSFRRNDVTNGHRAICFMLGHPDYGRADRARIELNRIHDCGRLPATNHDHGIYVAAASGAVIRGNWIYDNADRGIQLYPDAQDTTVIGNVIDGNGQGIIFSGDFGVSSSGNTVEGNVIANSRLRNNVESWYPEGNPIGGENVVRNNGVKGGVRDDGDGGIGDERGFTALATLRVRPVYADRAAGDLRLAADSPCRDVLANPDEVPGPDAPAEPVAERPALRKAAVRLTTPRLSLRRGTPLRLVGRVASERLRPGLRVTIMGRSHGRWRRLASAALDGDGRFSLRRRVRVGNGSRALRVRAVVRGVGSSRTIHLRIR